MALVSVIIPTYKGTVALARAIDSVLCQSYTEIEIIVVDDNHPSSEDRKETERIMSGYAKDTRIIYVKHEKNKNGSAARNTGLQTARGEYIAFLDDDDYYLPNRIEVSVDYLRIHPEMDGVCVGVDVLDEKGNTSFRTRPGKELKVKDLLLNEMIIGTGSNIFLRRSMIDKVHGFDVKFLRRQDIEFMIRICQQGKIGWISEYLVIKSVNGTNNCPSYKKMKTVIEDFSAKFQDEIEKLGNRKRDYYLTQYRTLFSAALSEHNADAIREAKNMINKVGCLTLRERVLAFVYIHNIRENCFVMFVFNLFKSVRSFYLR